MDRSYDLICWLRFFDLFFWWPETFHEAQKGKTLQKHLKKSYFLEGARGEQEAMERLDINNDKDTWMSDMRF